MKSLFSSFSPFASALPRLAVSLAVLYVGAAPFDSTAEERPKIGVSLSLTGNAATYGNDIKNVLVFANDKLAAGKYELVFEDDKCLPKEAVTVAHRFIDVVRPRIVAGFACSGTILAAAPLYERAKMVALSMSASAPEVSNAGNYIFRTWPSDSGAVTMLFDSLKRSVKRLGIMSEQTDYSQGVLEFVNTRLNTAGLAITNESFLTEDADFRTALRKLSVKGIDALYINSQTEATFLNVLKQVRELKMTVPVYGVYWGGSPSFLKEAGALSEGVRYVDTPLLDEVISGFGRSLYKEFSDRYGGLKSVDMLFVSTFEGFRAIHSALESGRDPRDYLNGTTFSGMAGPWTFDSNGDLKGTKFVMREIRGGKPEILP